MHFDIIFLDTTANKYYDRMTLEKHPLGGSEATVIRVAEGLASLGLKVAVVESRVPFFEPTMGQHCFFLHSDSLPDMTCQNYIQIRQNLNPHLFPGSRKFIWLHDVATAKETEWLSSLEEHKIGLIGVSSWHRGNIASKIPYYKDISYIYNPVPEEVYSAGADKYDKNLLVWMSSPHKGLKRALDLFKRIYEVNPKMKFVIFNPGYLELDTIKLSTQPGVVVYGPMSCKEMWAIVSQSLCVFYPTEWDETFGCVAAEANAMGVPLVTFKRAALAESVSSENQFAIDDEDAIKKVLDWSENGRPPIEGKEEFKFNNIIMEWVFLLSSRSIPKTKITY